MNVNVNGGKYRYGEVEDTVKYGMMIDTVRYDMLWIWEHGRCYEDTLLICKPNWRDAWGFRRTTENDRKKVSVVVEPKKHSRGCQGS